MRYSRVAKNKMAHFPHTPDTRLDFNNGISESDLADGKLASHTDAFGSFVSRIALRKEGFVTLLKYRF